MENQKLYLSSIYMLQTYIIGKYMLTKLDYIQV